MLTLWLLSGNISAEDFKSSYLLSQSISQNSFTVSGRIVDNSGTPLIGVTVKVKNAKAGTITDTEGYYTIAVDDLNGVLIISYLGFITQEVKVNRRSVINITMEENEQILNEVVVVGYGTMRKSDLSGAVVQMRADDLLKGNPASSINQALQGKMAGVQVNQNDGAPGGGINIQIRGVNSFSTSSQPLYIVDGIPFSPPSSPQSAENKDNSLEGSGNALSFINPHDIESINVLKDASATAIYGNRGANGVVIITTKKGVKGKPKIEFVSNFSTSRVLKKMNMLDAYTYAKYMNEEMDNAVKYDGASYSDYNFPSPGVWKYNKDVEGNILTARYYPSPEDYLNPGWYTDEFGNSKWVEGTNWQDEVFQSAFSQEYNLQVSGANDNGWYAFSGNYLNQEGIIRKSGFERYTLRANIGQRINKIIEVGLNINYTNSKTDFAKGNSVDFSVLRSALIYPSTEYYGDNTQGDDLLWLSANPRTYLLDSKNQMTSFNTFVSAYAELEIFKSLKFRQNIGISQFNNERSTYYKRTTGEGSVDKVNGRGGFSDNKRSHITTESMLTYNNTFNKIHNLNAVVAMTYETVSTQDKSMSASQFPTDITENYNMGSALNPDPLYSYKEKSQIMSYLGRLNYVLMDKYIMTASFRIDGTSKFHPDERWGTFLSGAVAWRASEEKFIKNLNVFDNLKFRFSFGQTGNEQIGSYQTLALQGVSKYPVNGALKSGFNSKLVSNSKLKWETTDQYNVGIDMSFLKNRINFTVDYYHKKTNDILQAVKVPPSSGFDYMTRNSGWVFNDGLEFTLGAHILQKTPLKWSIDANLSFNRNRIGGLDADQYSNRLWYRADNAFIQRNGNPIGAIFGYVEDGFYDNEAEVRADPKYTNESAAIVKAKVGEIKYRDIVPDGEINSSDMTIIGNTNPDYLFGITNNFEWRDFTFSFFLQGSVGNDIFNGNIMNVSMTNIGNIPVDAYNARWTPENTAGAKWPRPTTLQNRTSLISDRHVEDGSYVRLKNINLGYTLRKPKFLKGINSLHIYASATNLFTITDYSWYDPDVNAFGGDPSRRGVDVYSYPGSKTFSLGLKAEF
ncbi:TonB-dependent receptor [Prevotella sp. 10(H)]|uniref:SusC/RagA family TonB-linked outer membrane protein n=1 Tax=Prevotella sp. 10(H) TaxID=1158294 RepID=UPI0004A7454B|nr:TonB-dependent receptor [Prevotella sp. 10(H)]